VSEPRAKREGEERGRRERHTHLCVRETHAPRSVAHSPIHPPTCKHIPAHPPSPHTHLPSERKEGLRAPALLIQGSRFLRGSNSTSRPAAPRDCVLWESRVIHCIHVIHCIRVIHRINTSKNVELHVTPCCTVGLCVVGITCDTSHTRNTSHQ